MTIAIKKRSLIATLLLVLFLSFQGGRMFCYHTHVFGNSVISHSHPFNNAERQHSSSELESLAIITADLMTDNSTVIPDLPSPSFDGRKFITVAEEHTNKGFSHSLKGRSPPFFHVI